MKGGKEEKGHCVATKRGLLAAFLPPVSSTLSCCEAKMVKRNERLSRRHRRAAIGNGEPGFPYLESARLPPVIPCATGNPYERREPREISLNGLVPLSHPPLPLRSSTPAFSNTSRRRPSLCTCTSRKLSLYRTVSTFTSEITQIAPMTMDNVTRPVSCR